MASLILTESHMSCACCCLEPLLASVLPVALSDLSLESSSGGMLVSAARDWAQEQSPVPARQHWKTQVMTRIDPISQMDPLEFVIPKILRNGGETKKSGASI